MGDDFFRTSLSLTPFGGGGIGGDNTTAPVMVVDSFNYADDNRPAGQSIGNQTQSILNSLLNTGVQLGTNILSGKQQIAAAKVQSEVVNANNQPKISLIAYAVGGVVVLVIAILLLRKK